MPWWRLIVRSTIVRDVVVAVLEVVASALGRRGKLKR